jgi:hypothetical protein
MSPSRTLLAALVLASCKDVSSFNSNDDHFEGVVVSSAFVRAGVDDGTRLCLTLDTDRLEQVPGAITTSDHRFMATPLRPIPQAFHDPISTLDFGAGRTRNLMYAATEANGDVMVVVSLMQGGDVEVRLIRGAPNGSVDAGSTMQNVFGVFELKRTKGPCTL